MKTRLWYGLFGAALFWPALAVADPVDSVAMVNGWYAALAPGLGEAEQAARIGALLAPDARIELRDLGVTQTGAEFLASLPEWRDAIAKGKIAHRIEPGATSETVSAIVCFRFDGSELLSRELFTIASQVTAVLSETLSDTCADF